MKLKDWADKQGISYLTAWRWFKAGDARLINAYQSDSGTIIVPDEPVSSELEMNNIQDSHIMAVVLKKTVEFSKNQYAIEDFTAWLLSNFTLKLKGISDSPKYTKVKPKPEEIQNHFKQFLKPKGDKPKPNMFVAADETLDELMAQSDDLTTRDLVDEINKIGAAAGASVNLTDAPEVGDLMKDISFAIKTPVNYSGVDVKKLANVVEGVVSRSVDLTPQYLNYTNSCNSTFSNNSYPVASIGMTATNSLVSSIESSTLLRDASMPVQPVNGFIKYSDNDPETKANYLTFQPNQKELESASRISDAVERPRRGRKTI